MEEYYHQISQNDYTDKFYNEDIGFSEGNKNYLSKFLKDSNFSFRPSIFMDIQEKGYERLYIRNMFGILNNNLCISKLKDEWFLVYQSFHDNRFICDQMDGLIKLLDDFKHGNI